MTKLLFVVVMLFVTVLSVNAYGSPMVQQAKKEGWTFHFNEKNNRFATGLLKPQGFRAELTESINASETLPDHYDLRGKISPIENQGNCGSCWAFAETANLLDLHYLSGHNPGRLSQQYLVSCAKDSAGCNGGFFTSMDYLKAPKGSPLWSEMPYTATNGRCKSGTHPVASLVEWVYISTPEKPATPEQIMTAMVKYGPLVVTVGADSKYMSYESGIYNACTNQSMNHMVNLVGFDKKEQYWIQRNSWGTSWGEDGFMRIKWKGKTGKLCNNIAGYVAYVRIKNQPPPPPAPAKFSLESEAMKLDAEMKSGHEADLDKAKTHLQDALDKVK